ncbi:hypothetical protein D3C77_617370 [compost metagenome]
MAHQLRNGATQSGGVDPDVGDPVAARHLPNGLGLGREVHPPELVPLQDPELATRYQRWCHHDQTRGIA